MNPGNNFESVLEKVRFGDDIPSNLGLIPWNTTNPGNEFLKQVAELIVFCMRSQESDTFSLISGNEFPALWQSFLGIWPPRTQYR